MRLTFLAGVVGACAVAAAVSAAAPSSRSAVRNGPLVFDGFDPSTRTVQIYRISPTGHGLKQLTHAPRGSRIWSECPSWSSNGRTIFFDSNLPSQVYRISSQGTRRRRVDSPNAPPRTCPSPNRDASRLVVAEHPSPTISRIVRMTAKGKSAYVLVQTGNPYESLFDPRYAPAGNRIAFSFLEHNSSGQGYRRAEIVVIHRKSYRIITARSKGWFYVPSWSPNGRRLVAVRGNPYGGNEIVTLKPNGTSARHVARTSGAVSSVAFSPDGKKIAYVQCKNVCSPFHQERGASIWIMDANGSGKHAIFRQASGTVAPVQRVDWARR
jgi:Tol biopolymer transport system component